jgi:hypothetical protein
MTTKPPPHSIVRALLVSALVGSTLLVATGCGQDSASLAADADTRAPSESEGGYEVTVPALWADSKTSTSGIEPARIWATKDGASKFTIELEGIAAKGAGPQWTAASAAAAAVGSMVSGLNPGKVDVKFAITGPIDGPSAGGILTVGVLAALLNAPLRGDMTMTGTISPDGSIGPIGGVELKLKAAAEEGYSRVLLPLANMTVRDSSSNATMSAVEAGERLGLQVQGVGNVQEAFTLFTNGEFAYPAAPPFTLPAEVNAVTQQQASALLSRLSQELDTMPTGVDDSAAVSLLARAQSSADDGQTAAAYGIATQGLYLAGRERAAADMRDLIGKSDVLTASGELRAEIARLSALNEELLVSATNGAGSLGYEQQISVTNVLSWLTYDKAILDVLTSKIDSGSLDDDAAQRYARILSDARLELDVLYPDQLQVLMSAPSKASPGDSAMATYLSEYTSFLVGAGKAQQDYIETVVLRGVDPATLAATNDVGLLLPIILELGDSVNQIPADTGSLAQELIESTTAITYYIATASLIAAVQGFGIDQFGIGVDPDGASSPAVLEAAVTTSAAAVVEVSGLLYARGIDASLPFWGASTGTGAALALSGSDQETASDVRALNELYFDSINVFMLQSGPIMG